MNRLALFSLTALTVTAFADGEVAQTEVTQCDASEVAVASKCPATSKKKKTPPKPRPEIVKLTSASPNNAKGLYIFGDALYWHTDVDNTDWAFVETTPAAATPGIVKGTNEDIDFGWSWGFRVGIGLNMHHGDWDTNISYTQFNPSKTSSVTATAAQTASDLIGDATPGVTDTFTTGSTKWKIKFSMFDWQLGRWYYNCRQLALRPYAGLKGGWINQNVRQSFTTTTTTSAAAYKNNFWGVGPSAGVDMLWLFNNHNDGSSRFSIFGDFGGALMYGHFRVNSNKTTTTTATGVVASQFNPTGLNRNAATAMLQGILGFQWDVGFNRDRCHLGIKLGYELQYWFRQNQMLNVAVGKEPIYFRNAGDLALQGATLDVRFDF